MRSRGARWLEKLLEHKIRLEAELATILTEADPAKPLCSIVVPTPSEVKGDIHKDGARGFFKENAYRSLLDGKESKGLPGAGTREIKDRLAIEGLRLAQKKRNAFLAVNAKGEGGIPPYAGDDPAPKISCAMRPWPRTRMIAMQTQARNTTLKKAWTS
ncbi:hypothetical protein ABIF69_011093 [Bradyrhizobium japonicum]